MKKPLIVLTGPTAVGKTSLSISLAKAVNGEIISADSMQVYKGMDIGSAKIRREEMQGVAHYLIDVLEPEDEFHIVKFQEMAIAAMKEFYDKGKIPILACLDGEYPLEEAIRILKRDTRHFAKRQLTWFRREQDVIWLDKEAFHWNESEILEYMVNILSERGILERN